MTDRYALLFLLLTLWILPSSAAAQSFFTGTFSAAQETNDVESEATGTAALALTDEGLRYIISVEGLTGEITGAHFHEGAAGVSGDVVFPITDDFEGGTAIGMWSFADADNPLTDDLLTDLYAGNLYLNIHTPDYGPGEIRAQVYPTSGAGLSAHLTADQETNDVTSDGSGTAYVQVTDAGAAFFVTVSGLTGDITGAHFHEGATGISGDVVFPITDAFDGNTAFGFWSRTDASAPLTDELLTDLLLGNLYLNVHTAANGPGEIRGQVLLTSGWGFEAHLDADQETGDVDSDALGTATLTLTPAGLVYRLTANGLTGDITGAHFHEAPAGMDGDVVFPITDTFEGNTAVGVWLAGDGEGRLTTDLMRSLIAGNLYLNLHTPDYGPGEIRGQVLRTPGTSLTAHLDAAQETNEVDSDASGTATLSLGDDGLSYSVTVDGLTGDITGAHFHEGAIGVSGGVVFPITDDFEGNTATGMWSFTDADNPLTDDLLADLLLGNLYLNLHTPDFGPGEIRGQVYVNGGTGLHATLTNEQETNEVTQEASGTAALMLTDAGLLYSLTVDGLSGDITGAHFHEGAIGVSGDVVFPITDTFEGNTATGIWPSNDGLSEDMRNALLAGDLYLNVHTAANGPGEIRGQVELASGIGAAVHLSPEQETGDVTSDAQGTASLSLTSEGLIYNLTVENLTGDITGAHFHEGALGVSGDVVRGITDDFSGQTAFGVWRSSDDQSLSDALINELLAGAIYLNVHTAAHMPGELRGQIFPNGIVVTDVETVGGDVPKAFTLAQNYPNPFNPATTIEFSLTRSTHAVLAIYNTLGQKVATLVNQPLPAGTYRVTFDAGRLPSGVYHYRLEGGDHNRTRSMLLVK